MKVIRMADDRGNSEANGIRNQTAQGGRGSDVSNGFAGSKERPFIGGTGTASVRPVSSLSRVERFGGASARDGGQPGAGRDGDGWTTQRSEDGGRREAVRRGGAPADGQRASRAEAAAALGSRASKRAEEPAEDDDEYEEEDGREAPAWARVLFWLFRKSIVPIIMIVMLLAGLYIGYVYLGKQPEDEVFKWGTWQHLYDLIFADS